jgi:signal transduction histidine kinase/Tfp pilus assembly protein PilF
MKWGSWLARASVAALIAAAPGAVRAGPPELRPAITPDGFEARAAAAKAAMMTDPGEALRDALAALAAVRAAPADPRRDEHVATAQWLQAEALVRLRRADEAAPIAETALATAAAKVPNSKLHGDLTMTQAYVRANLGQAPAAVSGFQRAYRILGLAHQPRSQAMALMHIGAIYQEAGDAQKALEYYGQAADTYPEDVALTITARNNVGQALKSLKRYDQAVAEFEKARGLARKMGSPQLEADILTNLAAAEVLAGRLDAAQRHLDEDLAIARRDAGARDEEPFIWGVAAQAELARHNPRAAAQMLAKTFQGVDLANSPPPFHDFHQTAAEVYGELGDEHLALAHLKAFKRLDDQSRELAASTNAALMSAQFDFANQKTRIAQLKAGQLQRDIQLARAGAIIAIGVTISATIIAALFAFSFFWIRRSRNEVRDANEALSEVNVALEKALKARTEFLAATSHEIRTPLNGILGMTQVILSRAKLDADTREKVALVHGAGETMRALVDDILDMAKIETEGVTLNRAEFDLPQLARETVALWADRARAKGLSLDLAAETAPARIVEDPGRLRQILFNLMSNAVKFTETGGVTLRISVEEPMIEDPDETEHLRLAVVDTGVGIAPDKLEEVFESFRQADSSRTRAYEGTGLGLAICRKLAQAMGGDILLESAPGQGSTATLRIPLARGADAGSAGADAGRPTALADCRVLICDANPLTQAVVKATLSPKGRLVESVGSPAEAETAAASGRFDLLVVDAAALGGERQARLKALQRLARAAAPAEVVVLTPEIGEDEAGRLLGAGAVQLVRKPIAAAALADELQAGFAARAVSAGTGGGAAAGAA